MKTPQPPTQTKAAGFAVRSLGWIGVTRVDAAWMGSHNDSPPDDRSVTLALEARPESARIARRAVAELAAKAGISGELEADAKVVVTEAFAHASGVAQGEAADRPVRVEVKPDATGLDIVVSDSLDGFRPDLSRAECDGLALGLLVALCERIELRRPADGGAEVRARMGRGDKATAPGP